MADSVAELSIYNLALGYVGNPQVSTQAASAECQLYFPFVRDKLLTWAPWTFARARLALVRLAVPPPDDEYAYYYALPANPYPLRTLNIDSCGFPFSKEVYFAPSTPESQQNVLLTSAPTVVVRYIARVQLGICPPLFHDTLALWLALAIAQRVSGRVQLRAQLFAELQLQLGRLIDIDGHQDSPPRALNETYIFARGEDAYPGLEDIEELL